MTLPLIICMDASDCYRVLGLGPGASYDAVKASYRRLVRQYHPDLNPEDRAAQEKFLEITAAYKFLMATLSQTDTSTPKAASSSNHSSNRDQSKNSSPATSQRGTTVRITRKSPPVQFNPNLSETEQQIKAESYRQLRGLLRHHRYPRAIALVEGLVSRLPQDPEITQWQAIVYQQWGRQLIRDRQFDKARLYLKKALRTDPHNRSLWAEVEKDFRQIEQFF